MRLQHRLDMLPQIGVGFASFGDKGGPFVQRRQLNRFQKDLFLAIR
jgi:hypothetical protein